MKLVFDSIEAVPEAYRAKAQEQEGGGFVVELDALPDTSKLEGTVSALRKERDGAQKQARELKQQIEEFSPIAELIESFGGADQLKEVLAEREQHREKEAQEKGQTEELYKSKIANLEKKWAKEREQLVADIERWKSVFMSDRKAAKVSEAMNKIGVLPEYWDLAENYMKTRAEVREVDGQFDVVMPDGDGDKPLLEWAELYASTEKGQKIVRGPQTGGGGADTVNGGGQKPSNPFAKETWNVTEQGRLRMENPDRYRQLRAQHLKQKAAETARPTFIDG